MAPRKSSDPLIGMVVGEKYEVIERIGTGAMGSIYKAEHKSLQKTVALKVLHKHLVSEESHVKRFHREARAASRLNHPNCITVLDFGQTKDGWSYIAMEYLPGRDLSRISFEDGPMDPVRVVHIGAQVCDALDEAHAQGVIHRDMKPENVMVERLRSDPDFVKVLDFGIAKIRDIQGSEGSSFKTATGMVFGTPEYMSPEQIRGDDLDGRSDLYSLGVVLYQLVSGNLPFTGDSVLEVATAHLTKPAIPLTEVRPDVPRGLSIAISCLMEKKRDKRYANAAEAKYALQAAVSSVAVAPETVRDVSSEVTGTPANQGAGKALDKKAPAPKNSGPTSMSEEKTALSMQTDDVFQSVMSRSSGGRRIFWFLLGTAALAAIGTIVWMLTQ